MVEIVGDVIEHKLLSIHYTRLSSAIVSLDLVVVMIQVLVSVGCCFGTVVGVMNMRTTLTYVAVK